MKMVEPNSRIMCQFFLGKAFEIILFIDTYGKIVMAFGIVLVISVLYNTGMGFDFLFYRKIDLDLKK